MVNSKKHTAKRLAENILAPKAVFQEMALNFMQL